MVAARDVERVRAAYEATAPRLWRAVVAFAGSTAVADDAVAEAFAQVLRRGAEVVDVSAWVWRAAFSIARGDLARGRRDVAAVVDGIDDTDGALVDLLSALAGLPPADRELLVLRYVAGWTPTELAGLLGASPTAVRVRLHRARAKARPLFEEEP